MLGTGATEVVARLDDRAGFLDALREVSFDAVVHTPDAGTPLSYQDARRSFRARVEGTNTLIAAARRAGAERFVAASVYAGYGYRDHGAEPLPESAPFGLETDGRVQLVQRSLASLEQQVRAFGGVTLRYGILYRPGDKPGEYSADWDGDLPWLHVDDAADATVAALDNGAPRAVYNIADDDPASWRSVQRALAVRAGLAYPRPVRSWVLAARTPFAAHLVARTSMRLATGRAKRDLRWRPRFGSHKDAL
jgi:nucleoside-diphosphate-sugar epimerase